MLELSSIYKVGCIVFFLPVTVWGKKLSSCLVVLVYSTLEHLPERRRCYWPGYDGSAERLPAQFLMLDWHRHLQTLGCLKVSWGAVDYVEGGEQRGQGTVPEAPVMMVQMPPASPTGSCQLGNNEPLTDTEPH